MSEQRDKTLYAWLTERGIAPALCAGKGICGGCRVRYPKEAPPPAQAERRLFTPEELRRGYRLACLHAAPAGAAEEVEICFGQGREIKVVDTFLPAGNRQGPCKAQEGRDRQENQKGGRRCVPGETVLAIDLGTTTVAMQLREKAGGAVLGAYRCMNPQRRFGADVISRMEAAAKGKAEELRLLAVKALEDGVRFLCREAEVAGAARPELAALAGNTVMCHLLLGWDTVQLAEYPFRPFSLEGAKLQLAGLETLVLPGFSAFVGADVLAGALALELDRQEGDSAVLLADLGTNGEMILATGERCFCTAAAAGPAFEGGAGAEVPGSDMTALIAGLLREGIIDERGLLREPYFSAGAERDGVVLRQQDVRDFQLAKAAVRAGQEILFQKAGIRISEVERVWLAGGFGYFLDTESAFTSGLLPEELRGRVRAAGNTALQGAWLYASEPYQMEKRAREIKRRTQVCNLAQEPAFSESYVHSMDFPKQP